MYWKTIWIPQILGAVFGGVFVFVWERAKHRKLAAHHGRIYGNDTGKQRLYRLGGKDREKIDP